MGVAGGSTGSVLAGAGCSGRGPVRGGGSPAPTTSARGSRRMVNGPAEDPRATARTVSNLTYEGASSRTSTTRLSSETSWAMRYGSDEGTRSAADASRVMGLLARYRTVTTLSTRASPVPASTARTTTSLVAGSGPAWSDRPGVPSVHAAARASANRAGTRGGCMGRSRVGEPGGGPFVAKGRRGPSSARFSSPRGAHRGRLAPAAPATMIRDTPGTRQ